MIRDEVLFDKMLHLRNLYIYGLPQTHLLSDGTINILIGAIS